MDTIMLSSLVTVDSAPASLPSAPARALQRTSSGVPRRDLSIELQPRPLSLPVPLPATLVPKTADVPAATTNTTPGTQTREELEDLEMSRPTTPTAGAGHVDALQTIWNPYMNRFRFFAVCLLNFGNGINDSAPGALLPYLEAHYNLGYALVSLIFVGNALGFITAALFIDSIRESLGRGKALAVAQLLMTLGYLPMVTAAPFPVLVVGFFLVGFGMSLNLAISNVFCGSLANGTSALGVLHGSYGLGGTLGPLIATAIVSRPGAPWSRYYLLALGLAVLGAAVASWAFMSYERDESSLDQSVASAAAGGPHLHHQQQHAARAHARAHLQGMFSAFSSRIVVLGALFLFAYQGAEVSISGWVVSFLISARQGDPRHVGYVTAGFWAGITLGRFLLSGPAHRIGEKAFVYGVVAGAAVFELLVWLVPNVVGDAVAVAVVGLLLGPVYPCAAAVVMRNMSKGEQVSGLGVISAFGSSGGAAAPFVTGILAQAVGTFVLHPIAIGLFGMMLVCWYGLPSKERRDE